MRRGCACKGDVPNGVERAIPAVIGGAPRSYRQPMGDDNRDIGNEGRDSVGLEGERRIYALESRLSDASLKAEDI
jgi:hypothetical protein